MTEQPGRGCASCALAVVQLVVVAVLFAGAWAEEYFSWDPQSIPGPVGPYIVKMGVVAGIAAVAGIIAGVRGSGAVAYGQALVVVVTLIAMAVTDAMGDSAHEEHRRRECYDAPADPGCADVR
ncbi:DUF6234 family protein [Streptomyces cuspidosporus]|uniref:DUF6234 domain-containing protein n=1 Tax=Streptomyces cuspidosporus TaxID=66882 RepID=A0ABP5SE57_9ACTN